MAGDGLKWRVNRAVRASDLAAPARLIMFVLSDMADSKTAEIPEAHTPSLAELAAQSGLNVATVKRHLGALEKDGWVLRSRPSAEEKARHISTHYRLTIGSDGAQRAIEEADSMAQKEPSESEPMAQRAPSDGAESAIAMAHSAPSSHIYDRHDQLHDQNLLSEGQTNGALVAAPETPTAPSMPKPDPLARFEEFYRAYPRHVAKGAAEKAWKKAIAAGADPQLLIDCAALHAMERKMQDPQYTKHPATWLNQRCWEDEPDPVYTPPAGANGYAPNDYGSEAHMDRFIARHTTGETW